MASDENDDGLAGMPDLINDSSAGNTSDEDAPQKPKAKKAAKKKEPSWQQALLEGPSASTQANPGPDDDLQSFSAKDLKELITKAGLSTGDCLEKEDLVRRAKEARATLADTNAQERAQRARAQQEEAARVRREEEAAKRAAEERERQERERVKRLASERNAMADSLHAVKQPNDRGEMDNLERLIKNAYDLLLEHGNSKLRDAVNKAERRLDEGGKTVARNEEAAAEQRKAEERLQRIDKDMKTKRKSLATAGSGTEQLELALRGLVEERQQLSAALGASTELPEVIAAQLALAEAQSRRDKALQRRAVRRALGPRPPARATEVLAPRGPAAARARPPARARACFLFARRRGKAEAETKAARDAAEKLQEEKQALRDKVTKRDQQIEELKKARPARAASPGARARALPTPQRAHAPRAAPPRAPQAERAEERKLKKERLAKAEETAAQLTTQNEDLRRQLEATTREEATVRHMAALQQTELQEMGRRHQSTRQQLEDENERLRRQLQDLMPASGRGTTGRPPSAPTPPPAVAAPAPATRPPPTPPAAQPAEEERDCPICLEPVASCAIVTPDEVGKKVSLRGGVLTLDGKRAEVVWGSGSSEAVQPADMAGVVQSATGKVKSDVWISATLGGPPTRKFENPRRMEGGKAVRMESLFCSHTFHQHCIDAHYAKARAGGKTKKLCPECNTDQDEAQKQQAALEAQLLNGL